MTDLCDCRRSKGEVLYSNFMSWIDSTTEYKVNKGTKFHELNFDIQDAFVNASNNRKKKSNEKEEPRSVPGKPALPRRKPKTKTSKKTDIINSPSSNLTLTLI